MSSAVRPISADQLAGLADDGRRFELVAGELRVMSPAGGEHGRVAMRIGQLLANHVREHQLGVVYAAETGFLLTQNPDTVRAPDVAYVARGRIEALAGETFGYMPLAPDLAVEVTCPSDSFADVEEKATGWLLAGSRMVLVVNPKSRTVQVHRDPGNIAVLGRDDRLEADDVVAGWRVAVAEFFK
jgi:Uma2 family endonuclease